jgi:hypothetical protein
MILGTIFFQATAAAYRIARGREGGLLRRMPRAFSLLLAACATSSPRLPPEGDALILKAVLDGSLAAQDGLLQISRSAGWPIATSKGYLFALADQGNGPYTVSGAFGSATMSSSHGVAWALVPVAAPEGAAYRFASRGGGATFSDPFARRFAYDGRDEVSLVAAQAAHLERWPGIGDQRIAPRTLRVWVPAQRPVRFLYAHDGQNLFDPAGPWGGWDLQHAAGPATLIVGIDNTAARFDEYTPGATGAAYADFVMQTVRPFIEARYGVPARNGVMGSSLGGLIACFQELRNPGAWDFVASLSGVMRMISPQYAALPACPAAAFYLDSGGGPPAACGTDQDDLYCENVQMKQVLETLGCGPRLTYKWAQGMAHNEASWRARAPAILALFESL